MGKKKGKSAGRKNGTKLDLATFNGLAEGGGQVVGDVLLPTYSSGHSGDDSSRGFGAAGAANGDWTRQGPTVPGGMSAAGEQATGQGQPPGRADGDGDWRAIRSVPSGGPATGPSSGLSQPSATSWRGTASGGADGNSDWRSSGAVPAAPEPSHLKAEVQNGDHEQAAAAGRGDAAASWRSAEPAEPSGPGVTAPAGGVPDVTKQPGRALQASDWRGGATVVSAPPLPSREAASNNDANKLIPGRSLQDNDWRASSMQTRSPAAAVTQGAGGGAVTSQVEGRASWRRDGPLMMTQDERRRTTPTTTKSWRDGGGGGGGGGFTPVTRWAPRARAGKGAAVIRRQPLALHGANRTATATAVP
jgi:hypothetical protein